MTDHWEYYPCQVENETAFVFYDHGISETIDNLGIDNFVWLKAPLKTDNGHGLPLETEFDGLNNIDDGIEAFISPLQGAYVGRVTTGGFRFFHCYVNCSEADVQNFVKEAFEKTGYQLEYLIEEDKNKDHYWEDLFPSEEDLQVLKDLKVMEVLEENGDDPNKPRRIDHWIYFKTEQDMKSYQDWAANEGFAIESAGQTDDELHGNFYLLQIHNVGRPVLEEVSETTAKLVSKAEELNGEYDGWETSVESGQPQQ